VTRPTFRQVEAKEASKVLKEAQAQGTGKWYFSTRFDGGFTGESYLLMVQKSGKLTS